MGCIPAGSNKVHPRRPRFHKDFAAAGRGFLIVFPKIELALDELRAGRCSRLDPL